MNPGTASTARATVGSEEERSVFRGSRAARGLSSGGDGGSFGKRARSFQGGIVRDAGHLFFEKFPIHLLVSLVTAGLEDDSHRPDATDIFDGLATGRAGRITHVALQPSLVLEEAFLDRTPKMRSISSHTIVSRNELIGSY